MSRIRKLFKLPNPPCEDRREAEQEQMAHVQQRWLDTTHAELSDRVAQSQEKFKALQERVGVIPHEALEKAKGAGRQ